ncbi:MAG: hypothetical protein ACOZAO_00245 [Patescibacteria group bacterium]
MKRKELNQLLPQIIGLVVVIATVLISIGGKEIPIGTNVAKKVGRYSVKTYKYGVFLNQTPSRVFYNFSPYDAYYINDDNDQIRLLFWENLIVSSELSQPIGSFKSRLIALLSIFNQIQPKATFLTQDGPLVLETAVNNHMLNVKLAQSPYEGWGHHTVLTMSFDDNDYIFTQQGNLLTEKDSEEVKEFEKFFNYSLNPLNTEIEEFSENLEETEMVKKTPTPEDLKVKEAIYIVNPKTEGVLRIKQEFNQDAVIEVNLEKELIEFVQPSWKKAEATIELFDSLEEALNK